MYPNNPEHFSFFNSKKISSFELALFAYKYFTGKDRLSSEIALTSL
jgi:hypothetical protein